MMRKLIYTLFILTVALCGATAQNDVPTVQEPVTSDADEIIPITPEQAEELITQMMLEVRRPYVEARNNAYAVEKLKVDMLKRRLLDQALRKTYASEYLDKIDYLQSRMEHLETLLTLLVASQNNKNLLENPQVVALLSGQATPQVVQALPNAAYLNQSVPARPADKPAVSSSLKQGREVSEAEKKATEERLAQDPDATGETTYHGYLVKPVAPNQSSPDPVHVNIERQTADAQSDLVVINRRDVMPLLELMERTATKVYFAKSSAKLADKDKQLINALLERLNDYPEASLLLMGYSSPEGNMNFNNRLSERRVKAVADYLIEQGVASERIECKPSGIDSTKGNKKDARRVEIIPIH